MAIAIKQNLSTVNFSKYTTRTIKYLVIHYTGNNGDTAKGNTDYFKTTYRGASAHYFVDDTSVWQSVLDTNVSWHCGSSTAISKTAPYHNICTNSNSIGIELCSRKDSKGNYYFTDATFNNAVELVKVLMKKYNISANNIIRHYDVTYKQCPVPFVTNTTAWVNFKNKCSVTTATPTTESVKVSSTVANTFTVQIIASALNVRSTPSTSGTIMTVVKAPTKYTIVKTTTDGAWGLLKAYSAGQNGWISLNSSYVKKC